MLALILARGGSKGLPGKNIKKLNGKPLIEYTIEAAIESKKITKIVISTDSYEIADVCRKYTEVEIPFMRPKELASDSALSVDAYIYTIDRLNQEFGAQYNSFVTLNVTSPFRDGDDIDNAIHIFNEKNADSVISFYEAPHPVQWYKYIDDFGVLRPVLHAEHKLANRQNERISYLPNGSIYVFNIDVIRNRKYYTDKTYPYLMPVEKSVDIDSPLDFEIAECILRNRML